MPTLWKACTAGNKTKPNLRYDNALTHAKSINNHPKPENYFSLLVPKSLEV